MIKFFRKIRKKLADDNKPLKYMRYAIGEIVLVVIGILIALQINNWNEISKTRAREKVLLNEIHQEFLENKKQLETVVNFHKKAFNACDKIINQFPIDLETVNLDSLSVHLFNTTYRYTFNPSEGTINSLINTSSFETIRNEHLRKLVVSWQDVVNDYLEEELTAFYIEINFIEPYLSKHFTFDCNLRNPKSDLEALKSIEFEHLIQRRKESLSDILTYDTELGVIQNTIDEIIRLTDLSNTK
ncbi:MAG: DUF6090 family protein [Maribacter sp.]|nr:DUF6090 family protein [Maribacter sp.]